MKEIKDVLRKIARRSPKLKDTFILAEICSQWHKSVGEKIRRLSKPAHFSSGVLTVHYYDPRWEKHLRDLSPKIISRLNDRLGGKFVSRINFVPGKKPKRVKKISRKEPQIELPPNIVASASKIKDAKLREHFLSLVKKALSAGQREPQD